MQGENTIEIFKKIFFERIRASYCKRNNHKDKCFSAFINEKSKIKRIGILIGEEMFDDKENYNKEKILNDCDITESVIKLINIDSKNVINSEEIEKRFFGISETIKFFYLFSKLYATLFLNENEWYNIFICFLFQKKYELNKDDYINSIRYIISEAPIIKYKYEELLIIIKENYNSQNDIKHEFVIIFMNNKIEYLNKINEKLKVDPKNNLKELVLKKKEIECKIKDNNYQVKTEELNIDNQIVIPIEDIAQNNISVQEPINNISKPPEINKIDKNENVEENQIKDTNHNNYIINTGKEIENKNGFNSPNKENSNEIENIEIQEETKITSIETNIIHINDLKKNLITVRQYLQEKLKQYKTKYYSTRLLDYKLKHDYNFTYLDVSYLTSIPFEPNKKINDKVLNKLLQNISLDNIMPNIYEYGYFCYKDPEKGNVEALYSVINPELLYEDITRVNKGDDYKYPSTKLQDAYKKSRAKCFEYYIDKTIFEKRYKNRQFPRIIFPLKKIYKELPFQYNKYFYESEKEIDGCFYISKTFTLEKNEFPFESQCFKTYFTKLEDTGISSEDGYTFLEKDLCLIEIKTHFPNETYVFNNNEKDLYSTVKDMLKKMMIFEQLFQSIGLEYGRIRLILFYDLIRKKNYEYTLQEYFENFKETFKNLKYLHKVYFQIIYIDSSYFAETLKSFQDKIDFLEFEVKETNDKYDAIKRENEAIKLDNKDIKEKYDAIKSQNETIKSDNKDIKEKYDAIKRENDAMKLDNKDIKEKYDIVKAELQKNDEIFKIIYKTLGDEPKKQIDEILQKK